MEEKKVSKSKSETTKQQCTNKNAKKNEAKNTFQPLVDKIKKLDKKIIMIVSLLAIILVLIIVIVTNRKDSTNSYEDEMALKFDVKIHIDFTQNLLFSKYDVILSAENERKTLSHGINTDVEFTLKEGKNILYFTKIDDSSIKTEMTLDVDSNMEVGYKISCYQDRISVEELYIDKDKTISDNEVKMQLDKSEFIHKNYETVIQQFRDLGFYNIIEKPMYDIVLGWTDEGEVENVTINGSDTYKRGDIFKKDSEIIISYHLKEENDPSKAKPPYDISTAKSKKYQNVVSDFQVAGFTNVVTEEKKETNSYGHNTNDVADIYINGKSLGYSSSTYSKDAEIKIVYYVIAETEETNNSAEGPLSADIAQSTFEQYGKKAYPYGFKCHWWTKKIGEEHRADGSWFFKVGVTIKNMYGTKYDTTVEGTISGTDENPEVTHFYVYNQ